MKEENINRLIEKCEEFFHKNRYAEISIRNQKRRWNRGIVNFMTERNLEIYSPSVGTEYLENRVCIEKIKDTTRMERVKDIRVLNDMLMLGTIRKTGKSVICHSLEGKIGKDMFAFLENLKGNRRASKTLSHHRRNLSYFLDFLYAQGKESSSEITESDITAYIDICRNKLSSLTTLKLLFNFWEQNGITSGHFAELFKEFRIKRKERIPSFYTTDEVIKMEQSINRNSPIGKRDYAMFLLASRLGLRASDIATLTFSELDWDSSLLKKKTQKTGAYIELPLLADVGNAIIDYLQNARPKSDSEKLFLLGRSPYSPLNAGVVSTQINNIIKKANVDIRNRHHGAHALRHSLASAMLESNVSIETISETLGHCNSETTMCYLKIDIESLRKCSLDVPAVPKSFYIQRGGAFYEKF